MTQIWKSDPNVFFIDAIFLAKIRNDVKGKICLGSSCLCVCVCVSLSVQDSSGLRAFLIAQATVFNEVTTGQL